MKVTATSIRLTALAGALSLGGACAGGDAPSGPGVRVTVAPLTLDDVTEVIYHLEVRGAGGGSVWREENLRSTRFGAGDGSLSYVGPCDASAGANPNTVRLELVSMWSGAVELHDFINPAPVGSPIVLEAECLENRDAPIDFNLVIMRRANQGFFDIAVDFEDIFCSAKVDCVDALLHYPAGHPDAGLRGPTMIIGFACAAGTGQTTWLHMSDARIRCPEEADVVIDPSRGPGNIGGADYIYEAATYKLKEAFPDIDKCTWNLALGIDEPTLPAGCTLELDATASQAFWPAGQSPDGAVYPYIQWSVPLSGESAGVMTCGPSPLDGPDGQVKTTYTSAAGVSFDHQRACGGSVECVGQAGAGRTVSSQIDEGGLVVTVGQTESEPAALPPELEGYHLGTAGCCVEDCCDTSP